MPTSQPYPINVKVHEKFAQSQNSDAIKFKFALTTIDESASLQSSIETNKTKSILAGNREFTKTPSVLNIGDCDVESREELSDRQPLDKPKLQDYSIIKKMEEVQTPTNRNNLKIEEERPALDAVKEMQRQLAEQMQQMQDMFINKFKKLKQKNKILFTQT